MKGFKGFNKDMKCKGFQYVEGKEYKQKEKPSICNNGFHFCENPFDVFTYYFSGAKFAEIEALGETDKQSDGDTKRSTNHIKIVKELDLRDLIKSGFDYIRTLAKISNKSNITAGYSAHSSTAGDYAHSSTAGNSAHSSTAGKESIAVAIGIKSQSKSIKGNWLVLSEWEIKDNKWIVKSVKTVKVDGKKIKENTWYKLEKGKFVEVE